jgi:hypothetical protein
MVGIGFPVVAGAMTNSDAVIGWASASETSIARYTIGSMKSDVCSAGGTYFNRSHSTLPFRLNISGICKGAIQDLEDAEVFEENGMTTLKFTRARASLGSSVPLVAPMELQNLNLALGHADGITYHSEKCGIANFIMPAISGENSTQHPNVQSPGMCMVKVVT